MKNVVILILEIAIVGTGIVLAKLIFQPRNTVQDGVDQSAAQEAGWSQTAPQAAATQPAVQRFPQLQGGCCGGGGQTTIQNGAAQGVEVGNKICPVSGRPIGVMGPGVEETYNGKIYHLCCGGCISTFESDPQKYSKIADDEVASQGK